MRTIAFASSVFLIACTNGSAPPTQPGSGVYTSAVESLVLENKGGGFTAPPPPGGCATGKATFTVLVDSRMLGWSMCNDSNVMTTGSRVLSATEWTALEAKLDDLVVVTSTTCGADKAEVALTVKTSGGSQAYGDAFYGCQIHDRPLVASEALDAADYAMRGLASQ
jgi:hypothetical protein